MVGRWIIAGIGVGVCILLGGASAPFILPKAPKLSTSHLREQCLADLPALLALSPKTLNLVAQLQELGMDCMQNMLDGSFFHATDKKMLECHTRVLRECVQRQEKINVLMQEQVVALGGFLKS
jgi:hypothetical protein